jgi:hypothetical protein
MSRKDYLGQIEKEYAFLNKGKNSMRLNKLVPGKYRAKEIEIIQTRHPEIFERNDHPMQTITKIFRERIS